VAVHDIGLAVANAFEDPITWIDRDVTLMGDIKTLGESREIFMSVDGKNPFRVPLPLWLFKKMAGDEFIQMWQWLVDYVKKSGRKGLLELGNPSRQLCPEPLDMESWLRMVRNGASL
jgi:hypothetical protein